MEETNTNQFRRENEEIKNIINEKIDEFQTTIDVMYYGALDEKAYALYEMDEIEKDQLESRLDENKKELEEAQKKQEEMRKVLNDFEKLENDIETVDFQIESKQDEIETLNNTVQYLENGAAMANLEQDFAMGYITEEEYNNQIEENEKELTQAKSKIETLGVEIDELKENKKKLLQDREKIKSDVLGKGPKNKENIQKKEEEKVEENNEEVKKDSNDREEDKDNNNENNNKSNVEINNKEKKEKDDEEQENSTVNQTQAKKENNELEVYKKPNRFLAFFKKIIDKIRNIGNKENRQELNQIVNEELQNEGINLSQEELEHSNFMQELNENIYSQEEATKNTHERVEKDSIDDRNKTKSNIEQQLF